MDEEAAKIKELEARKLALIERYMKMQDEADELNERIYNICCEIEALNLSISKAKEDEEKRRAAAAKSALHPPANGKAHPASVRAPDQAANN
jgi:hypothetical protein